MLALTAHAIITIESGQKYRFTCMSYDGIGYMVLGANHGSPAYVYYDITLDVPTEDCYWVLTSDGGGFTIKNAQSGQYLIYKDERVQNEAGEWVAKGIQLADNVTDNTGRWTFSENNQGAVIIASLQDPGQTFNLRQDGTYLIGTYDNASGANSFFMIYDEKGNSIVSDPNEGDGTAGVLQGLSGKTSAGEYWERTGIATPVVYTTNRQDPVLYTIMNVRSGHYATIDNGYVVQRTENPTKFYFTNSDEGTNIYSSDGQYVCTSYTRNPQSLAVESGTTAGRNLWDIGYSEIGSYEGYTIGKLDNLPSFENWMQSSYLYWNDYDTADGRLIGLYDVDNGSTFVFLSSDNRHVQHLLSNGVTFEGTESSGFNAYVENVRINGKDLIYDTKSKAFYSPLPENARGGNDFTGTLEVAMKQTDAIYTLKIDSYTADTEGNITIPGISCDMPYTMTVIKNGTETVATAQLHFTFLPIVEVTVPSCNSSYYTTGSLRVTDPNSTGYDETVIAAFRYRGASSQNYNKKSYAIKLRDAQGNSVDREYFGLRDDNNWILDAMAVDKACMRNRVSTDLWNDFATEPYHKREGWEKKARTGTRGEFVEVFLNGRYHGLYCMTEKMDRKQLKLKKIETPADGSEQIVHGTLYKSSQWNYEVLMGHDAGIEYFPGTPPSSYDNNRRAETWANYEIKYPDWEEEKIDWGPLWNAINFVATSSDEEFDSQLEEWFDFPVIKDYYLYIELMLATDNHGKNMFFFNYDQLGEKYTQMIGIAPWDLDGTWGRRWDGSDYYTRARQDFTSFLWNYEHGTHTIFHRLQNSNSWEWQNLLKERYAELRGTHFTKELLSQRFRDYCELFSESKAIDREEERWYSYHNDIAGDVEYICQWISDRIDYLDEQYEYDPVIDGISSVTGTDGNISAIGGKGTITLYATKATTAYIYNVSGMLVRTIQLDRPTVQADGFTPGIYIVNGKKVLVK